MFLCGFTLLFILKPIYSSLRDMFIICWQTTAFKTVFICTVPSQQTAGSTSKLTDTAPPRKKQQNTSKTPTRLRPDTNLWSTSKRLSIQVANTHSHELCSKSQASDERQCALTPHAYCNPTANHARCRGFSIFTQCVYSFCFFQFFSVSILLLKQFYFCHMEIQKSNVATVLAR